MQPPAWEKWSIVESILDHPGEAKHLGRMQWHSKGCPFAFSAPRHTAQPTAKLPLDASSHGVASTCVRTSQS